MNHMSEVAKLFGKELGEEFIIAGEKCKCTEDGVELYDPYFESWVEDELLLRRLLTDETEIVRDE